MDKIQGGGSFSVCPDTGAVTRDKDSTAPEGAGQEQARTGQEVAAPVDAEPAPFPAPARKTRKE